MGALQATSILPTQSAAYAPLIEFKTAYDAYLRPRNFGLVVPGTQRTAVRRNPTPAWPASCRCGAPGDAPAALVWR
jgi:hypothetical protein